ncbi:MULTISPECIES: class I SAM-dependent methyltransferase [unclassified Variovorax]|uniref:class I SAM-dependent methyltransferase n=1 Tax=unclassified Variovorax TaxID=663243 RepID=UPI001316C0EE|nr:MULTISPECIES: class I SAM-dependent methyltransferase [unclassified Variovorax]VTU19991.1 Trans-aconitate methyltransferase [Variovorax sp. SRS16]VTU28164.1 Trans-aconitate methyltransferase [Variovorax sp. PBL-E5]
MNARVSTDAAWRQLHEAATAPYKKAGKFAWHFARGKLGRDPVFRGLVERGLIGEGRSRVVDIGCGQGLFASLLSAMGAMQSQPGRWPASWCVTATPADYTGIELMPKDVARAEASVGHLQPAPRFLCADMCTAALPATDLVVILDVLHYVDLEAQEGVLRRVRDALQPGGRLLLRIGDAADRRAFAISQYVDRTVTRVRGHRVSPTWGRPLKDWMALLQRLGFSVQSLPMSEGTPFANVLLVADLKEFS